MSIRFACPTCHKKLRSDLKQVGKYAACPKCGSTVVVPAATLVKGAVGQADEVVESPPRQSTPPPVPPVSSQGQELLRQGEHRRSALSRHIQTVVKNRAFVVVSAGLVIAASFLFGLSLRPPHTGAQSQPVEPGSNVFSDQSVTGAQVQKESTPLSELSSPASGEEVVRSGTSEPGRSQTQRSTEGKEPDLAAAFNSTRGQSIDLPALIRMVEPSVVRIDCDSGVGAGFLLESATTVVTNFHVIRGANKARVTFRDGTFAEVLGVRAILPEVDVAVLVVSNDKYLPEPLRLASALPEKGESVVAFGTPAGLSFSTTEGIVSAIRTGRELGSILQLGLYDEVSNSDGLSADSKWIQTSAPVSPGNSGGPLVNLRGEVVGINTLRYKDGQNLNFAISSTEIARLISPAETLAVPLAFIAKPARMPESKVLTAEKDALAGLASIRVVVGEVGSDVARLAMTAEEMRSLMERKLRDDGINVCGEDDVKSPLGILYVNLNGFAHENGAGFIYVLDCSLSRLVGINPYARNEASVTFATVWKGRATYGYAGQRVFESTVRRGIESMADTFSDAFLSVNAK